MDLTPKIELEVLTAFRQTRSPFKASRKVNVDIEDVFAVLKKHEEALAAAQERHGGWGRDDIRPFLVARHICTVSEPLWNNKIPEIADARAAFEAGTHDLGTGRDGAWLLLYSFPRKGRPMPKAGYFKPEVAS